MSVPMSVHESISVGLDFSLGLAFAKDVLACLLQKTSGEGG
jgi:hypothetical protein